MEDSELLTEMRLEMGDVVQNNEGTVQVKLMDELIVMKGLPTSVVHQVLDEMPEPQGDHTTEMLKVATTVAALEDETQTKKDCLKGINVPSRMEFVNCIAGSNYTSVRELVLETYVSSTACLELRYFDPGGKGFSLCGSLVSNEGELVDDEYDYKAIHVDFVRDRDALEVLYMNDVKDAKPPLLDKSELVGSFLMLSKLTTHGRMMNKLAASLIFDPGGLEVTCVNCATRILTRICADLSCHFGADSEFGHAKVNHTFQKLILVRNQVLTSDDVNILMFNPGGQLFRALSKLSLVEFQFFRIFLLGKAYLFYAAFASVSACIMLLQLSLEDHIQRAEILVFDPGEEVAVRILQTIKIGDFDMVLAFIKLFKLQEFEHMLMCSYDVKGRLLRPFKGSYYGSPQLTFDPGITFGQYYLKAHEISNTNKEAAILSDTDAYVQQAVVMEVEIMQEDDNLAPFALHHPCVGGSSPRRNLASEFDYAIRSWDILWLMKELFCAIFCAEEATAEDLSTRGNNTMKFAFDIDVLSEIFNAFFKPYEHGGDICIVETSFSTPNDNDVYPSSLEENCPAGASISPPGYFTKIFQAKQPRCSLYLVDLVILTASGISGMMNASSMGFTFHPGRKYSRSAGAYFCYATTEVCCQLMIYYLSCHMPLLRAFLLILEDKDPLKKGVLMQDYELSSDLCCFTFY